jgi:hypothetical protein
MAPACTLAAGEYSIDSAARIARKVPFLWL